MILQTLDIKKVTTNELQTFYYKLWITPLFSTWNVFRGIIDSLNCRGKINDVGWKRLFFGVKKHTTYFLLYFLYEKTTSHMHTFILNTFILNTFLW